MPFFVDTSALFKRYQVEASQTVNELLERGVGADELIQKRYMKPIDALQLAVALNNLPTNLTIISADKRLCDIAQAEGASAVTPK